MTSANEPHTTDLPSQQCAKGFDTSRRLGGEPQPFISKPVELSIYRARSVTAQHVSRENSSILWWLRFEIGTEGQTGTAALSLTDTELFVQLNAVLGFSPADLRIGVRHDFHLKPEVHVSDGNPYFKLHQICVPSNQEIIAALKAHAEHVGALTAKHGADVDQLIREHITQAQKPDFDGAWKAIADLTTPMEKANIASEIIKDQAKAGLEATKDPHYASPLTDEMVKHYEADLFVDELKAAGATEVEIEDTPPLPGNGGKSELETWLPREDKMTEQADVKTLGQDLSTQAKWASFWSNAKNLCSANDIPEAYQEDHIHKALLGPDYKGRSVKEFPGTLNDAYAKIKASFDTKTKHTEPPADNAQKGAENGATSHEVPTPPATANEAPAGKSEPQVALISSTIPETPFVVLFTLYTPGGLEMKYTVRAMSADALESQADDLIKRLIKKGYTTRRMAEVAGQAAAQNGGSTAPAQPPASADKGTSPCMLIKCVKSYEKQKPQLEIEVDGFEKPFRFTQEKWEQLTKVLKGHKANGAQFTADDMGEGKKYAGNWLLDWEKKTKDDKTFWNVIAVRDAA